jgi:hypothetical protein
MMIMEDDDAGYHGDIGDSSVADGDVDDGVFEKPKPASNGGFTYFFDNLFGVRHEGPRDHTSTPPLSSSPLTNRDWSLGPFTPSHPPIGADHDAGSCSRGDEDTEHVVAPPGPHATSASPRKRDWYNLFSAVDNAIRDCIVEDEKDRKRIALEPAAEPLADPVKEPVASTKSSSSTSRRKRGEGMSTNLKNRIRRTEVQNDVLSIMSLPIPDGMDPPANTRQRTLVELFGYLGDIRSGTVKLDALMDEDTPRSAFFKGITCYMYWMRSFNPLEPITPIDVFSMNNSTKTREFKTMLTVGDVIDFVQFEMVHPQYVSRRTNDAALTDRINQEIFTRRGITVPEEHRWRTVTKRAYTKNQSKKKNKQD